METVVVTRHTALVQLLRERGIIGDGAKVIAHATPDDVRGKHVVGVLPLSLAALAATVTEIPLALTPEDRGKELGIERLREIAGSAVTYKVTVVKN
ncbi:MAG: CRISPR-associated protein Csx16 [Candidatus Bathyarchaeia archaeon]